MISEAIQVEKHNQQGVKKCSGRRVKMMEEQTTKNKKRERERERGRIRPRFPKSFVPHRQTDKTEKRNFTNNA